MDETAFRHAKARLVAAEAALVGLQAAGTFDEIEARWTDFLLSSAAIFNKLEQGAKVSASSKSWFADKKALRRGDELLRYLHHARNSNEHGISDTTHRKAVGAEWVFPNGKKAHMRFDHPDVELVEHDTGGVPIHRIIRYSDLAPVFDRGVRYDPPSSHLGQAVTTRDPREISELAISSFRQIVAEAEALIVKTPR